MKSVDLQDILFLMQFLLKYQKVIIFIFLSKNMSLKEKPEFLGNIVLFSEIP